MYFHYSFRSHDKHDSGDSSDTQDCHDTAAASYSSKDIAGQLSDMVVYTEPVKFTGFKVETMLLCV